jgi:hypothetical protein
LNSVVNGISTGDWESLPTVAQTLYFAVTARDGMSNGGYGCPVIDKTTITVAATSGQYGVTSPNGGEILGQNQVTTVTWNEAGTASAPINSTNVDIRLSTDGGITYPTVLATGVPNNGSAVVNMPDVTTSTARLWVSGANNIFYDISDADFNLAPAGFALAGTNISAQTCAGEDRVDTYEVTVASVGGFSGDVTLASTGLPAGVTATFDPSSVNFAPGATTTQRTVGLTLTGLTGLTSGNYTFQATASNGGNTQMTELTLQVAIPVTSPADGAQFMLESNPNCGDGAFFFNNIVFTPYSGPETVTGYTLNFTADGSPGPAVITPSLPFTSGFCFNDATILVYTITANLANGSTVSSCARSLTLRTTLLPVDWLAFDARAVGKAAQLDWAVVQDEAHAGFTIERQTTSSSNWTSVGYLARTATDGEATYQFTDQEIVAGNTYLYRLRQEDVDGTTSYSTVRSVTFDEAAYGISIWPNPTNDFVTVVLGSSLPEELTYELFSSLGQRIASGKVLSGRARISLGELPAALYQVVISNGTDFREVIRVVKR